MRIVTPPLVIEESDAFKDDLFSRKAFGEALLNLIERSQDELVISLDGKWGEGKTTFVKMWQGLLAESKIPNLYIDAFKNDYADDAFISIASSITAYAEKNISKGDSEKVTELKEKTKKVGGQLLSWSTKVAIKAATLGIIKDSDLEELKDIKNDISKGVSEIAGSFIEDRLNSHLKDIELIQSFKDVLSEIPLQLEDNDGKPLVIIIDELDRCKPTFAVEVIEKIKHLFLVKNVVFVLVMHKAQLEESVKCVYGENIDAHTYLQKFITIESVIPKQTGDRYSNDLSIYCKKLYLLHELETWEDKSSLIESIEILSNHFSLSLRQLEKVFTNLALFYGSVSERHLRISPIISFLAVIKVIKPVVFNKLLHKKISYNELCSETNLLSFDEESENNRNLHWLLMWVKYSILTEEEFQQVDSESKIHRFGESHWRYSVDREELMVIFAKKMSMFIVS